MISTLAVEIRPWMFRIEIQKEFISKLGLISTMFSYE